MAEIRKINTKNNIREWYIYKNIYFSNNVYSTIYICEFKEKRDIWNK